MWSSRGLSRRSAVATIWLATALFSSAAAADPAPAASATSVDAPTPATAREPMPPSTTPAPATVWTPRKRLLASAGATTFVLPYLASAIAATTGYPQDDGETSSRAVLWVPAVGPFIALGDGYDALASFFLVLDGVAQVGGLSLLVYGLVSPASAHADDSAKPGQIMVAPTMVHGAPGGAVAFTF